MTISLTDVDQYIAKHLRDTELYVKLTAMMKYIVDATNTEIKDVKEKYTNPSGLSEESIRQIMYEQGYNYIVNLMDTLTGVQFNTMISFIDLIDQLKGTRAGLELVLKLLGFDSIIKEWWEDPSDLGEEWTYEIIVLFNTSNVPDIFDTLDKIYEFSNNYVLADISNVEVRFIFSNFADKATILGGFSKKTVFGTIIERAV